MDMNALYDIREMLCKELDEIARKPEMSAGDLETVHKLTDTVKNIQKISMLDNGWHSGSGEWDSHGTYIGNSYRGKGREPHGSYHRDRYADGNRFRDGRSGGMYSMSGGKEEMIEKLEEMLNEASGEKERQVIRRCMEQLESM